MAETFGFYLMRLDVRQESDVHTDAVDEIVGESVLGLCSNYKELDVGERIELLSKAIASPPPVERIEVSLMESEGEIIPVLVHPAANPV